MITIAEGLYTHRAGSMLIISDQHELPRATAPRSKILVIAENHAALERKLRHWLSSHQLDEIATAMQISRSAAHRLRAAMNITPRGGYAK